SKLLEFQIKTKDGSVVDVLIKPVKEALLASKMQIAINSRHVAQPSPGLKKKDGKKTKSPQSNRKEYSSLENARQMRSNPELAKSADRLTASSVSFMTDTE